MSLKVADQMTQIVEQVEHIDQIVHRFHAMAEERRGLFTHEDSIQLVKDALQACPIMVNRAITSVFEIGAEPVHIHANRRVLKVALIHTLGNTAGAIPSGGHIFIRIDSDPEPASVTFIDQGGRFSQTELHRLHQQKNGMTPLGQPGLLLVRQNLAEHQGYLEVENSAETGQGRLDALCFPHI